VPLQASVKQWEQEGTVYPTLQLTKDRLAYAQGAELIAKMRTLESATRAELAELAELAKQQ
jgi:DNA-binding XRE family transcriptional regulator